MSHESIHAKYKAIKRDRQIRFNAEARARAKYFMSRHLTPQQLHSIAQDQEAARVQEIAAKIADANSA